MTEIDEMTQQLTRSAAHALQAARLAVDRHRQRSARQREEARHEREHRLRIFETHLRTTVLQRQLAAKEGNDQLAAELASIERDHRTGELIARWAAAEAHRPDDPELADAWTSLLEKAGIDPEVARAQSAQLVGVPEVETELSGAQLAADYTDMASDFADQRAQTVVDHNGVGTGHDNDAETSWLIGLAHPAERPLGPIAAPTQAPPQAAHAVDREHVSQL